MSIAVLSFTGYYVHAPFIVGQVQYPFLMGWFRFVHETFGMIFIALFLLRMYMFFGGNRWVGWRQYVPLSKAQFIEMINVSKFYMFVNPKPVSKVGHNAMAAFSYLGLYSLVLVEIVTGLVMFNWLAVTVRSLTPPIGWIPRLIAFPQSAADSFPTDVRVHRVWHLPRAFVHADLARRKARADGQHLHRLQSRPGA